MVDDYLTQSITQSREVFSATAIDPSAKSEISIASFNGIIQFASGDVIYPAHKLTAEYDYKMTVKSGQTIRADDIIRCEGNEYRVVIVIVSPITPKSFSKIDTYGIKFIEVGQ